MKSFLIFLGVAALAAAPLGAQSAPQPAAQPAAEAGAAARLLGLAQERAAAGDFQMARVLTEQAAQLMRGAPVAAATLSDGSFQLAQPALALAMGQAYTDVLQPPDAPTAATPASPPELALLGGLGYVQEPRSRDRYERFSSPVQGGGDEILESLRAIRRELQGIRGEIAGLRAEMGRPHAGMSESGPRGGVQFYAPVAPGMPAAPAAPPQPGGGSWWELRRQPSAAPSGPQGGPPTGRISGRITDGHGEPVEEAEVWELQEDEGSAMVEVEPGVFTLMQKGGEEGGVRERESEGRLLEFRPETREMQASPDRFRVRRGDPAVAELMAELEASRAEIERLKVLIGQAGSPAAGSRAPAPSPRSPR